MARSPRSDVFDPDEVSVFHCINRCVRQCHLCGKDELTGNNYEHRRQWIEQRIAYLAQHFGIDVLSYAVLANHFHLVLRNRPDIVAGWSDTEVARRWLQLCPLRKRPDGSPETPSEAELDTIRNVPQRLAEIRKRLSHISWMMGMIAERIARLSNDEEQRTGRFWEGRYRGIKLCDDAAVLACMAYVDLNPVRAGLACTPEASDFTSVQRRIRELQKVTGMAPVRSRERWQEQDEQAGTPHRAERGTAADGAHVTGRWLAPLGEGSTEPGPQASRSGARCSDKAALPIRLNDYLQLLDWTGRQLRQGETGAIPDHLAPILKRLGIGGRTEWLNAASRFEKIFYRIAGRPETIRRERTRRGQRPFRGAKANVFTTGEPTAANQ